MKNIMEIDGYKAVIQYDPEIEMFRGEFLGLNGGADFYAKDIDGLRHEGAISLRAFLDACKERGIEPRKSFSGKFNVRISPGLHADIVSAAASSDKSLNEWVAETLDHAVHADDVALASAASREGVVTLAAMMSLDKPEGGSANPAAHENKKTA